MKKDSSFTKVYASVMDEILSETDSVCLATYIAILRHRNTKTNKCFPSIPTISDIVHVSDRTVKRKIEELYNKGFLIINSGKQGVSNNYYFPKESFFEDWNDNAEQLLAYRRKNTFKKKSESNDIDKDEESTEIDFDDIF